MDENLNNSENRTQENVTIPPQAGAGADIGKEGAAAPQQWDAPDAAAQPGQAVTVDAASVLGAPAQPLQQQAGWDAGATPQAAWQGGAPPPPREGQQGGWNAPQPGGWNNAGAGQPMQGQNGIWAPQGQNGNWVPQGQQVQAPGQPGVQAAAMQPPQPKKKAKAGLIVVIVVAALLVLALLFYFVIRPLLGSRAATGDTEPYTMNAMLFKGYGGEAVVMQSDGTVVETGIVTGDVALDADGENMAYIDEDGVLYWYNLASAEATRVDDAAQVLYMPFSKYVLYSQSDTADVDEILAAAGAVSGDSSYIETMFGALFEGRTVEDALSLYRMVTGEEYPLHGRVLLWNKERGTSEELFSADEAREGAVFSYRTSLHEKQMGYVNSQNDVVLMDENGQQTILWQAPKAVEVSFSGVPDTGNLAVWRVQDEDDNVSVYGYVGGIDDKLFSVESEYVTLAYVEYAADYESALVYTTHLEEVYEIGTDGTLETFRVDGEKISDIIFNNVTYMRPQNLDNFYVVTYDGGTEYTLYHMDENRERDKIVAVSGVYPRFKVCDDQIFYLDEDQNLITRRWENATLGDPTRVAGEVNELKVSADGQTVWYTKGDSPDAAIYRYEMQSGESERIDAGATSLYITPDGDSAVYIKNAEPPDGMNLEVGDLYVYQNGAATQIAGGVPLYTVEAYYRGGFINLDRLSFVGDLYEEEDPPAAYGNLYVYSGGEAVREASDVQFETFEY